MGVQLQHKKTKKFVHIQNEGKVLKDISWGPKEGAFEWASEQEQQGFIEHWCALKKQKMWEKMHPDVQVLQSVMEGIWSGVPRMQKRWDEKTGFETAAQASESAKLYQAVIMYIKNALIVSDALGGAFSTSVCEAIKKEIGTAEDRKLQEYAQKRYQMRVQAERAHQDSVFYNLVLQSVGEVTGANGTLQVIGGGVKIKGAHEYVGNPKVQEHVREQFAKEVVQRVEQWMGSPEVNAKLKAKVCNCGYWDGLLDLVVQCREYGKMDVKRMKFSLSSVDNMLVEDQVQQHSGFLGVYKDGRYAVKVGSERITLSSDRDNATIWGSLERAQNALLATSDPHNWCLVECALQVKSVRPLKGFEGLHEAGQKYNSFIERQVLGTVVAQSEKGEEGSQPKAKLGRRSI